MTSDAIVLRAATVLTMDGRAASDAAALALGDPLRPDAAGRRAVAVAVAGGRIVAVGAEQDVVAAVGPGAAVVDLGQAALLPGFVDAHAHPLWTGIEAGWPTLPTGPDLRSAMRALPGHAEHLPPDDWLVVRYDQTAWHDGRHPTRDDLDRAVPDRPVLVNHVSGHALVTNSLGLALAGITAGSADRDGAAIDRDGHGEPTGLLEGPGAWAWIAAAMPRRESAELAEAISRAGRGLAGDGVTAVSDADLGGVVDVATELAGWGAAVADGRFALRVGLLPGLVHLAPQLDLDPPTPADVAAGLPPEARRLIRLDRAKLFADGALTTRSAWLSEPYADDASTGGLPAHAPAALAERVRRAAAAGWAVATHAIGDAAIGATLDAYAAAGPAPGGRRHRIDHAMLLPPDLLARLAADGVPVVLQPEFVTWAGDTYLARLGPARAGYLNRYASLLAAGVALAFSSDRPVVGGAPLDGVRAALRHAGPSGASLAAVERPSVAEALRAWTAGGAAAMDDPDGGVLEAGRRADFVVLSADPLTVPAAAWASRQDGIGIVATIIGGRLAAGTLADGPALEGPRA